MNPLRLVSVLGAGCLIVVGCSREPVGLAIQKGTEVSVEKTDGATVAGRLVEAQPQEIVLETVNGERTRVARSEIRALHAVTAPSSKSAPPPAPPAAPAAPAAPAPDDQASSRKGDAEKAPPRAEEAVEGAKRSAAEAERVAAEAKPLPEYREIRIPAGTALLINLRTTVGSATSRVEDQVRGTLRRSIAIDEVEAIPAGATVLGTVTAAERSGRVKGRARVAFRFAELAVPDDAERISIRTAPVVREAQATKKEDAAKIGGGAAAGALIGGIIGGGDGAAKGAAIGGGAGTGVVLSTRGKEITVPAGTNLSTTLLEPVTVRVRIN